jgi:hypothetical protein
MKTGREFSLPGLTYRGRDGTMPGHVWAGPG